MKLSSLTQNAAALEAGAWVDRIPECGDLEIRTRGIGNADWRRRHAQLVEALPRDRRIGGRLSPADEDAIVTACLLETALLDWRNLEEDGAPLAYTRERAELLLRDPTYRPLRAACLWAASVVADQREADLEADAGN